MERGSKKHLLFWFPAPFFLNYTQNKPINEKKVLKVLLTWLKKKKHPHFADSDRISGWVRLHCTKKAGRDPAAHSESWVRGPAGCGRSRWVSGWLRGSISALRPRAHAARCEVHGDGSLMHSPRTNGICLAGLRSDLGAHAPAVSLGSPPS